LKNVAGNNPLDFTSQRLMSLNAKGLQVGVAFLNLEGQPGPASHSNHCRLLIADCQFYSEEHFVSRQFGNRKSAIGNAL